MKKNYFTLLLMLLFCCIGKVQAGVVVKEIGTALTDVSSIAEGDYLAFKNMENNLFLYTSEYATDSVWRLRFKKGNFEAALGTETSMHYVYKVVDFKEGSFRLQAHTGGYIGELLNDKPGKYNYIEEEGEYFSIEPSAEEGKWLVRSAGGRYFGLDSWKESLNGVSTGVPFEIYEPVIGEGAATVTVTFECYDEDGNVAPLRNATHDVVVGGTVTVPGAEYFYTFLSCVGEDGTEYKQGDVITVTADAVFTITVRPWPTITFLYVDEEGNPICEEGSTEQAKYSFQWQPGSYLTNIGGVDGYYIPEETKAEYAAIQVTDENKEYTIVCKKCPFITVRYVDNKEQDIADPFEGYIPPGESITVKEISGYTLAATDSIYVYDYENQTGYTVGTADTTIVLHYDRSLQPFTATTIENGVLAADTKWYTIAFHGNQYMTNEFKLVTLKGVEDITDALLWAFVGNMNDGFMIYNKVTGGSKAMGVEVVEQGAVPAMVEEGDAFVLEFNWREQYNFGLPLDKNEYVRACLNDFEGKGEVKMFAGEWEEGGTGYEGCSLTFTEVSELVSGVEGVTAVQSTDSRIYDLQGRSVSRPVKGLYIINGKKVIVK